MSGASRQFGNPVCGIRMRNREYIAGVGHSFGMAVDEFGQFGGVTILGDAVPDSHQFVGFFAKKWQICY